MSECLVLRDNTMVKQLPIYSYTRLIDPFLCNELVVMYTAWCCMRTILDKTIPIMQGSITENKKWLTTIKTKYKILSQPL